MRTLTSLPLILGALVILSWRTAASETPAPPPRPLLVTVDDLPVASGKLHQDPAERSRITRDLLAALKKHNISAVGMVTWANVQGDSDLRLLEAWLAAGHELGNHSYSHPDLTATTAMEYTTDVDKARVALATLLGSHGKSLRFFRYPFLCEGDTTEKLRAVREYLARSSQRNLPVTIDDQDWSFEEDWVNADRAGDGEAKAEIGADYQAALRVVVSRHERRGDRLFSRRLPQVLLLHANLIGTAQWDALFAWLERSGHRFATADEVLSDPAFAEPHEFVAPFGCGLWDRLWQGRLEEQAKEEVEALLHTQAVAWSRGDVEAFCSAYAPDAAFVSPSGLTQGRQAVLERYRKRYPDSAAMGTLTLDVIESRPAWGEEVTPGGDAVPGRIHAVSVVARWTLSYPAKPPATGLTLLVLHRRGASWEIVQDASM